MWWCLLAIVVVIGAFIILAGYGVFEDGESGAFQRYDPNALGDSDLDRYLRESEPRNSFFYVGELSSGRPFAVLISLSKEWVNVVALNRARSPEYVTYGFNVREERWSYGSAPLGAPEIRQFLKEAKPEIRSKIVGLWSERRASAKRRKMYEAQEAEQEAAERREYRAMQQEIARVQKVREPSLQANFGGVSFEFNENKARHEAAQKDAERHYYDVDLYAQTCSCDDFARNNARHPTGDILRLCEHLATIIGRRSLLRRHSDPLCQFILEESLRDVLGVHTGQLTDGKRFGVVVRCWPDVVVAAPRVREDGFVRTIWRFENGAWTSSNCSKRYKEELAQKLADLLPE